MVKKNQTATVTVLDMNSLGYGIAKTDGFVTFVQGGVTGDCARVKIIKAAKDYAVAKVEEILTPSPYRREPGCSSFPQCGGCSFRNLDRAYELKLKKEFVRAAFHKNRLDPDINDVLTDGEADGYRNKVQYPVAPDGSFGYYARHSHRIVPASACPLSDPAFLPLAEFASDYIKQTGAEVRHIYLRRARATGQTMFCLVSKTPALPKEEALVADLTARFPEVKSVVLNFHPEESNVILGEKQRILYGEDLIEDILCGFRFGISSRSFYQVNRGAAELLYREAIRRGSADGPSTLADLYCGAGTIGLCFAGSVPGLSVTGVEIVPEAVENAKRNAERNGIDGARFLCGDATALPLEGFDCIVTDPPRKGLSRELTEKLLSCRPHKIVYVSCEPGTLARDAAQLIQAGYTMGDVTPVDMFPRTGAVECVTDFVI